MELTDIDEEIEGHEYYTHSKKRRNITNREKPHGCDTSKTVDTIENLFTVDTYDWRWPSDDDVDALQDNCTGMS